MNIHEKILELIADLGIQVDVDGKMGDVDSFAFISLVIRIEETFNISFPDEFLLLDLVRNVSKLETIVTNIVEE